MQTLLKITLTALLLAILFQVAVTAVDRITVRDCARGIQGACEEVKRLNLK